jgi:uncharacterized protein involved in exopolysaccharide biosynthesis
MSAPPSSDTRSRADTLQYQSAPDDDEISLWDLWDVLVRRRWWLINTWALTVLLAATFLLVAQPIFESRAVVRVGRLAGEHVTPPASLILNLREKFAVGEEGRLLPFLSTVDKQGEDALVLETQAGSAIEARDFLLQIVREIEAEQRQRYEVARQAQEAALVAVDAQVSAVNEQIARLAEMVNTDRADEAVRALVVLQRGNLQTVLPALHKQRLAIQRDLSSLNSYDTQLVKAPTLSKVAASPKPAIVLALGVVIGGMLGFIVALFVEFFQQARARSRGR